VVILTVLLPVGDHQVHTHAPARIPGIAPAVEAVTSVAYNDGDRTGESFSFDWVNATGPPLLLYGAPQTDRVRVTWIDVQHLLYLHARGNSFSSNRARALSRSCRTDFCRRTSPETSLGAAGDQEEIGRPDRAEGGGAITYFAVSKT
jgi:hypothetical protein